MDEAWPDYCSECGRHLDTEQPTKPCAGCCVWLDGAKVADWVQRYMEKHEISVTGRLARRLYAWRYEGELIRVGIVDKIACELGFHLNELPVHVWLTEGPQFRRKHSPEVKRIALRRLENGEPVGRIARDSGAAVSTVHKWRRKAAA